MSRHGLQVRPSTTAESQVTVSRQSSTKTKPIIGFATESQYANTIWLRGWSRDQDRSLVVVLQGEIGRNIAPTNTFQWCMRGTHYITMKHLYIGILHIHVHGPSLGELKPFIIVAVPPPYSHQKQSGKSFPCLLLQMHHFRFCVCLRSLFSFCPVARSSIVGLRATCMSCLAGISWV